MNFVLGLFLVLLFVGMPIGFAFCIPALLYLIQHGIPLSVIVQELTQRLNSFTLLAIPLFIMAGRFMNEGGVTKRIFRFANNAVGYIPGGLGQVNVVSSMIFAGMSGAAVSDIGGLGQVEIKAMKEAGYPVRFIAGITAASAIVGPIIPPSIPVILFSVASETSTLALFAGGVFPGLMIGLLLMVTVSIYANLGKFPTQAFFGFRELFVSFYCSIPALMAPVLLIGGMLGGIFSPTEAAGVTVLYSLALSFFYKELKLKSITPILLDLLSEITKLTFVIASSQLFAWILIIEELPQSIAILLSNLELGTTGILLVIALFFLIIGFFLEATIVFLVIAPMFVPSLTALGISQVHFGIITILAMGIGMYTPPVGVALYMIQGLCEITFEEAVKAILPFIIPLLIALLIIIFFPTIVTFLPTYLGLGQ